MDKESALKELSTLWVRKRVMDFLGVVNMYIAVSSVLAMAAGAASSMSIAVTVTCSLAILSVLNAKLKIQLAMRELRKEIGAMRP